MRPVRNLFSIPNSFTLRKAALKGLKAWVAAWCKFFFWWCYSYGPQQGPDRQQKKRGGRAQAEEKARGSCSRRPRTRERKPGKRKGPK